MVGFACNVQVNLGFDLQTGIDVLMETIGWLWCKLHEMHSKYELYLKAIKLDLIRDEQQIYKK